MSWACSCPMLAPRSIAVTGFLADSGVSMEKPGAIYAQHAPRATAPPCLATNRLRPPQISCMIIMLKTNFQSR